MPSKWSNGGTGYNGLFGDSFFSDCWDVMDNTSRRSKKIVHEGVTDDISEESIKPWFRKSHLNRFSDDDIYQVMLEVSNFTPSELNIKLVNDKTVIVEGRHGERADRDGFVSREFTRKYNLPESVNPSTVECFLSKDGVLVIRGHAPRPRSSSPRVESVVPIFTDGYHTRHSSGSSSTHHTERIIPITHEENNRGQNQKSHFSSENGKVHTTNGTNGNGDLGSGRSSRSSDRMTMTPSPQPRDFIREMSKSGRSRTVSFNDDDTIASNSPIIEEPPSIASERPTPEPQPHSSKRMPPLTRQNNVGETISEYRSSSRMSEERSTRSQTPPTPSPKPKPAHHIETVHIDVDDKRDLFPRGDRDLLVRTKSPLEDFDKLHKEIIERHRHLSRESLDRMQAETDKFFQSIRTRSPLFHKTTTTNGNGHGKGNGDIFDTALKTFDRPFTWESNIPPKSREQQIERKSEKGYDKDGKWVEKSEERMVSQSFSSNYEPLSMTMTRDKAKPLEHSINISSPA